VLAVPRLCEFYSGICLTTEEKAQKNLSQGKKKPQSKYSDDNDDDDNNNNGFTPGLLATLEKNSLVIAPFFVSSY
jgi:hypothetical protein